MSNVHRKCLPALAPGFLAAVFLAAFAPSVQAQSADLTVSLIEPSSGRYLVNDATSARVTYTVRVTNNGPNRAENVVIRSGANPTRLIVSTYGSCIGGNCTVSFIESGASIEGSTRYLGDSYGITTITATASSSTPDPNPINNQADVVLQRVRYESCSDPFTVPAWDGRLLTIGSDTYLPLGFQMTADMFELSRMRNVRVTGVHDTQLNDISSRFNVSAGSTSSGDYIRFTYGAAPSPQTVYLKVTALSGPPPQWDFGVTVKDYCGRTASRDRFGSSIVVQEATGADGYYARKTLAFGLHPSATPGIDAALGEVELPPMPPMGVFDARLVSAGGAALGQGALIDNRTGDYLNAGARTHEIRFQRSVEGVPVYFNYSFPHDVRGRLRDVITGSIVDVTLAGVGTFTLTNGAIDRLSLSVQYAQACGDVPLTSGWNLVSAPATAASMAPVNLFPGTTNPYGYSTAYEPAAALMLGRGYWVRASSAATRSVCGVIAPTLTTPLVAGWNLVGPFDLPVAVSALTTEPAGLVASSFYGYAGGYSVASTLQPGRGYWVKASAAGALRLFPAAPAPSAPARADDEVAGVRLVVVDAVGQRATLRMGAPATDAAPNGLPPAPPSGAFDVRFAGDRAAVGPAGLLALQAVTYPVRLELEGDGAVAVSDPAGRPLGVVSAGVPVVVADGDRFALALTGAVAVDPAASVPDRLTLSHPAPNPVRTAGAVRFGLPSAGDVRLALFDALGREVAVLAEGPHPAGWHRAGVGAGALAPGLYVVRLAAGGQSVVQTLTVAR